MKPERTFARPPRPAVDVPDGWISVRDAADLALCSRETVRVACRRGTVEAERPEGGAWIIRRASVSAWSDALRRRAEEAGSAHMKGGAVQ